AVAADQQARDAAVLGEYQQAGGIDVEPARGGEPPALPRREADGRAVGGPVAGLLDELDGRAVARFGLAGDESDRLVQQDGHPGMLFVPGGRVDLDASLGSYAGAEDI